MKRYLFLYLAMGGAVGVSCGGENDARFEPISDSDGGAGAGGTGGAGGSGGGDSADASGPLACSEGCEDGQRCDPLKDECVDCLFDHDCGEGQRCLADRTCEALVPCNNSLDCTEAPRGQSICDESAGVCVQCIIDSDCGASGACQDSVCQPYEPCSQTSDCDDGTLCETELGRCVACLSDAHCDAGDRCIGNACRVAYECASDNDCTSHGLLCDTMSGYCAECRRHSDCPDVYHCELGQCMPDVCEQGETGCESGSIVTCSAEGDAFENPQPCEQGVCVEHGASASCEAPDGGVDGCSLVFYRDSDEDGFGDPTDSVSGCAAPAGYVDNADDCYDDNANAKPGQADYFAEDRGDGSFDYDCADGATPSLTESGACGGFPGCTATEGWDGTPPDCGQSAEWIIGCTGLVDVCQKTTDTRPQECH